MTEAVCALCGKSAKSEEVEVREGEKVFHLNCYLLYRRRRGYWRHVGTDRIWAVEIEDGRPVKCAGPFDVRDVGREILEHLDYSTTYVGPLQAEWQRYVSLELCCVCGTALRGSAVTPDGGAHLSCPL